MMTGKMRKEGRSIDGERLRLRRILWVTHSCNSTSDVYDFSFPLPVHQQDTGATLTWESSWGYWGSDSSCLSTLKCVDAAVQIILLPFGWVWNSLQVIKIWMNINSLDRIFCPAVLLKLLNAVLIDFFSYHHREEEHHNKLTQMLLVRVLTNNSLLPNNLKLCLCPPDDCEGHYSLSLFCSLLKNYVSL